MIIGPNVRQWKCPNGHVLGVVKRVDVKNDQGETRTVSRLIVFRHAIDLEQPMPEEVDVLGDLEGTMLRIRCDVEGCRSVRTWEWGEDAFELAMEKMGVDVQAKRQTNESASRS